ncbi:hypothetical protein [uncultured Marinobacter sp.]|mgnify:FL=1|uniref:hypothetical protein n=1 Tax=uncultured Marinobacter sp. TaxID=187379 RepID=UPI00259009E4|nr:hypothetical protein [uncultured Marinobacter sp.]
MLHSDIDHLSIWEVAHRWHDQDPNNSDPSALPLPVQDMLRTITLRRLRNIEGERKGLVSQLEKAADNGDWKKYVELMGGVCLQLKDRPLRALMVPKTTENKYHEIAEQLKGLVGSAGRGVIVKSGV